MHYGKGLSQCKKWKEVYMLENGLSKQWGWWSFLKERWRQIFQWPLEMIREARCAWWSGGCSSNIHPPTNGPHAKEPSVVVVREIRGNGLSWPRTQKTELIWTWKGWHTQWSLMGQKASLCCNCFTYSDFQAWLDARTRRRRGRRSGQSCNWFNVPPEFRRKQNFFFSHQMPFYLCPKLSPPKKHLHAF